jgi:hypothetical protein
MQKFLQQNSLSLVLFGLFFVFLVGLSIVGNVHENEELAEHQQPPQTYVQYITSPHFIEAVSENWESEFLQMGALVVLTIWLRQKGSADSKKLRGKEDVDTQSRYSIIAASSWSKRFKSLGHVLYAHSLSIALFGLFALSFVAHLFSGAEAANEEALLHGEAVKSVGEYLGTSQFWFESLQNWQSEFLAVGALLVLSVYLRQRHSPESKPVGESNAKTGH